MLQIPRDLDYAALERQEKYNQEESDRISKEREEFRKKRGLLSASTLWYPCEMFPYLELTKGMEGLKPRDKQVLAKLQWGRECEPLNEQKLVRMYDGNLKVMRRADATFGTFVEDKAHGICGTMDRRFKFGNEILAGELKTIGFAGATLWAKQENGEDLFDYFCNPGAAAPWWQSWAGQALLYTWFLHQRNPSVNRCVISILWKDNGWIWPVWVDMREHEDLLNKILTRAKFLHKALKGDEDVVVRRTKNWKQLCQKCPRLFQCGPEIIAGITNAPIKDDAAFDLARRELKLKEAKKEYETAHNQLRDILKANETFKEHTCMPFEQEYILTNSHGDRIALQVKNVKKEIKAKEAHVRWEQHFTPLPVEMEP